MLKACPNLCLKWNVCRVCLEQSENMISIFTKDDSELLAKKIADCGDIEIESNRAYYPDKICPKCIAYLNIAYKFRTTCKNSDNVLRTILSEVKDDSFNKKLFTISLPSASAIEQQTNNPFAVAEFKSSTSNDDKQLIVQFDQSEAADDTIYDEVTNHATNNEEEINHYHSVEHHQIETVVVDEVENIKICEQYYDLQEEDEIEADDENDGKDVSYVESQGKKTIKIEQQENKNKLRKSQRNHKIIDQQNNDNTIEIDNSADFGHKRRINDVNDDNDDENEDSIARDSLKQRKTKVIHHNNKKLDKIISIDQDGSAVIKSSSSSSTRSKLLRRDGISDRHDKLDEYICEICGNKYKKRFLLDSHIKWHSEHKAYKCEVCGREFTINFQLTRHMRVHTGAKPYSCEICGRKFSDYSTCKKHTRTHTDERPFKCEICEKAFNYSHVLKVHMTTHTGEKPFACNQCDKKFSQRHHLKAHLATLSHQGIGSPIIIAATPPPPPSPPPIKAEIQQITSYYDSGNGVFIVDSSGLLGMQQQQQNDAGGGDNGT